MDFPVNRLLILLGCSIACLIAGDVFAAEPEWIWITKNAHQMAPAGACYIRKTFEIDAPESGRVEITCDNLFELYVNNRRVGTGDNWQQMQAFDLQPFLVKGKNVLAVVARNTDGPAGLAARVVVSSKAKKTQDYSTDSSWRGAAKPQDGWRTAEFDDAGWMPVFSLGAFLKTAPWGGGIQVVAASKNPQFTAKPRPSGPFQLLDGDRVVFLGNTLIERAQANDYIETALTTRYPDRNIEFRNLGWSGDTVFGEARAGFGTPTEGFRQLQQQVFDLRPTVILVGYGAVASFAGETGIPKFRAGLETLLDTLETTQATIVLMSPIPHEKLPPPLPDPGDRNEMIRRYGLVIQEVAHSRGHQFLDLFDHLGKVTRSDDGPLTDNGIHLTSFGYWRAAQAIERGLQLDEAKWSVEISADGKSLDVVGTKLSEPKAASGSLGFTLKDAVLPAPLSPRGTGGRVIRIPGLPAGQYTLQIDGANVAQATHTEWSTGVRIAAGPEFDQVEKLRQTIVKKNQLYFYRWRPQNETYLFGFRKHEQGQNAREIPLFDPLVAEQETLIAELRRPVSHRYLLQREQGK